ncbi:MAG: hypothetical protein IJA10_10400 [Lachnospiraceae bacterium]|nr:hypothetical protein [Lachnospiraceae bacterium]
MNIINVEEIIENDSTYIVTTYDNGCIVQELKPLENTGEQKEEILSETDEAILNTNINIEYLVALQELGL